jgi:hypothetical protein
MCDPFPVPRSIIWKLPEIAFQEQVKRLFTMILGKNGQGALQV